MTNRNITAVYKDEKVWFFVTISIMGFLSALYMYFVISSVVHVVMRKELDHEIIVVSSYVSQLESQYINAQHAVSADVATQNGYQEVEEKIFIARTPTTLVLSQNDEG